MTNVPRAFSEQIDPLTASCQVLGINPPDIHEIVRGDMPEPYRGLLDHNRDMTSTLERFCGTRLHLRVIEKHIENQQLTRHVILQTDTNDQPIEFGAIRIYLNQFRDAPRREIESCTRPLGTILEHHRIVYSCLPSAFLTCPNSPFIERVFGIDGVDDLYGRCNTILGERGEPLAQVVEILAPIGNSHKATDQ